MHKDGTEVTYDLYAYSVDIDIDIVIEKGTEFVS